MPRSKFRAHFVTPGFREKSTDLSFGGGHTRDGDTIGLCLARFKPPEDEGIYLSFPHGFCEHTAAIASAHLKRTVFLLVLAPSSVAKMQGHARFEISFVLTDDEFTNLARALADIFRDLPCYTPPTPPSYAS